MKKLFIACISVILTGIGGLKAQTPHIVFREGIQEITVQAATGQCGAQANYTDPQFTTGDSIPLYFRPFGIFSGNPYFFNGHYYYLYNSRVSWSVVKNFAHDLGLDLVTVNSQAENNFVQNSLVGGSYVMGLNDVATEGNFVWDNGEPVTYINWSSGEPNNANNNENYVEINASNGTWNDININGNNDVEYIFESPLPRSTGFIQPHLVSGLQSGAFFPAGRNVCIWEVSDFQGNVYRDSIIINVIDNQKPAFTTTAIRTDIFVNSCSATAQFTLPVPSATDYCSVQSVTNDHPSDIFPFGKTIVTWTATDASGNTASRYDTVWLKELIAPEFNDCPSNIIVNSPSNSCGAIVNFSAPTYADNCNAPTNVDEQFDAVSKVQSFTVPAGVTILHIEAVGGAGGKVTDPDSHRTYGRGAYMSGDFTVTPGETLYLIVGSKGAGAERNGTGGGGTFVSRDPLFTSGLLIAAGGGGGGGWDEANGIGNPDASISENGNGGGGYPMTNQFALGGINGNGGAAVDISFSSPGAGAGWLTDGNNTAGTSNAGKSPRNGAMGGISFYSVDGAFGGAGAGGGQDGGSGGGGYSGGGGGNSNLFGGGGGSFNSGTNQNNTGGINAVAGKIVITYTGTYPVMKQTSGLAAGSLFPTGVTINTWVIEDASGNKATCSNTVTVKDVTAPQVQCLSDIHVNADPGQCTAVVNYTAVITDNCGQLSPIVPATYKYLGEFEAHKYYLSSSAVPFAQAKDSAIALGGVLACIGSSAERIFLNNALYPYDAGWVGAYQNPNNVAYAEPAGGWEWLDGSTFTNDYWYPDGPVDDPPAGNNNAGYTATDNGNGPDGLMFDLAGFNDFQFIVEIAPSIKTTLLSGLESGSAFPVGTTNISLSVADSSGNTAATCSFNVIVNGIPAQPAGISGPTNVCPYINSGTTITYSVPATLNATGYQWTVPPTVSIVSGQGTNSITVSIGSGFAANANKQIRVKGTNACGTAGAEKIFYLAAQSPTTAAAIQTSSNDICLAIGNNSPITFTIPKVTAAISYIWNAQAGTTSITHPNGIGANDTTISVIFNNEFTTSAITVQSVNDCGIGGVRSFTITRSNPAAPSLISGPTNVCANIGATAVAAVYSVAAATGTTYNWTVPVAATGLTGQGTNTISFIYPTAFTNGSISVTATNGCGTGSARTLTVSKLNPATPGIIDVIQTGFCPDRIYSYTLASMPANAVSVQWTVPAAAIGFSGQGTASITVSYPATAVNGSITAQAISNCGVSTIRATQVKLPACPTPTFTKNNLNTEKQPAANIDAKLSFVTVMPNPSVSSFKLMIASVSKQKIQARITDVSGRLIKTFSISTNQRIDFGNALKAGIYLLEINDAGKRYVERLVKL